MQSKIIIQKISYKNAEDVRIIKSCLETWFQNPKDLNLVDPSLKYPFNFNKWIEKYLNQEHNRSFVLKENNWIVGYMSLQLHPRRASVHLFHVFIDRGYRSKGYGKMLIDHTIEYAQKTDAHIITLFVNPTNEKAINIYTSYGFMETGELGKSGGPKLILDISKIS